MAPSGKASAPNRIGVLALALVSIFLVSTPAFADSTGATRVSLPKGPGSIEGLASADFAPSLASGSASYSIPLAVPPGSAGLGPALALVYDSSGGVSEVGLGWSTSGTVKLRRRTEDGLPLFDETDRFELVGLGIPSELLQVAPRFFRPRYEDGSFVRVERSTAGNEWEVRTKAGAILRLGGEGYTESEGSHVAAYLLREQADRHGHRVRYEWDTTEGHALLTHVVWNDFDDSARNEASFTYGERPDPISRFSTGIREAVTRRLEAVEVRHGGALVRRYDIAYGAGLHPAISTITLVGSDGVTRMPSASFAYTAAKLTAAAGDVVDMTNAPGRSPASPDAALSDLDGDGLPDLLLGTAGHYRSYLNHDGKRWLPPRDWSSSESPSASLSAVGVQLADVDADGAADLLVKSGTDSFRYFPGAGARFGLPLSLASVPSFTFEDGDVRLADLDGDRRTDVILTTPAGIAVGYRRGNDWTEPAFVGRVDAKEDVRFSDGHTELCDINGDRVQDLCALRSTSLVYWLGRGRGHFEAATTAEGVPTFDASRPYRLDDLDGDGWTDLVRVDVTTVSYALAVGEGVFGAVRTIDGVPHQGPNTAVRFADMNGSGTVDIVWVDLDESASSASWRYLELFPDGRAGLLRRIDNGLGKVQTIEYSPAASDAAAARDASTPWQTRMNVAMPVVRRITMDASLGDPKEVAEYTYRDGAYDPNERTFAGFGSGTERELGDEWTPTLVSQTTFDDGLTHRVLRGAPRVREVRDANGDVVSRTTTEYDARVVATSLDGTGVEYAAKASEVTEHVEGRAIVAVKRTRTEYDEDDFGNVVSERRLGDAARTGDEAVVTRTFAQNEDEWLLGFLATEELGDGDGKRTALTRKYYDGAAFTGLPVGSVTRGDLTREESWVGPGASDFELVLATTFNADGQPAETRDARGGGHVFEWASDRTSIASERVKLEGKTPLIERAAIDGAFGNLVAVTEYNGETTRYAYDAFGRLETVIRPGDTDALPTATYAYEARAPLSRIVTLLRVVSGETAVERSEALQDGFGRARGSLTLDGKRALLAGVSLYDARGNARRSLLPRFLTDAERRALPLLDATPRGTDTWRDGTGREIRTRSVSGIVSRTEHWPLETRHWDGGQSDEASPYEHTPTITVTDGLGRVTEHAQTIEGKILSARYTYDPAGALLSRTDPEGAVARYQYDGRGRRISVSDPDQGDHRFTFDTTGNLVGHRYPDGVTARFTFDLAGRSLTEDANGDGNPDVTRFWDTDRDGSNRPLQRGKLVQIADETGGSRHEYDARGRIVETTLTIADRDYVVRSSFDAQDREALHVYPDGSSIDIRRNARGQISGYGQALSFEYGEDGLETARRFSTGVTVTSGYDADRRRSDLAVAANDDNVVEALHWTYDAAGNLTKLEDRRTGVSPTDDRTEAYQYDNLYRLARVEGAWGTTAWHFSPSGSLLGRESSDPAQALGTVRYGVRPHAPTAFDDHAVAYDERGRMTTDGERTYTWNEADELVRATANGAATTNEYDAEGTRRVRIERAKDGTESTTHFIDPWSEVKDGRLVRYIVHGGQRIVRLGKTGAAVAPAAGMWAGLAGGTALALTSGNVVSTLLAVVLLLAVATRLPRRFRPIVGALTTAVVVALGIAGCSSDAGRAPSVGAQGSVQELTDEDTLLTTDLLGSLLGETTGTGKPTSRFSTYPFGATRADTSRESQKYAGNPHDGAVALESMGARFYAPSLGVFSSADPVALTEPNRLLTEDFAAANPYAYAKDSPLVASDRDGRFFQLASGAVGAVLGAITGGGIEAARQYLASGRVESWGRVAAAATGGAISGAIVGACPVVALGSVMGIGSVSNVASGVTERLVASGGSEAGTLREVAIDAATGAATAGLLKGGSSLAKAALQRSPALARAVGSAAARSTAATTGVLFGQKGVGRTFTAPGAQNTFKYAGRAIADVASGLRNGTILADEIPIGVVRFGDRLVAVNNRSLTALSRAGLKPTRIIDMSDDLKTVQKVLGRLSEMSGPSGTIQIRGAGAGASAIY
jgi:RHS repeat-associated protein